MTTTTPPKPRRLLCAPRYGAAANTTPLRIDGWEAVDLFNFGTGDTPAIRGGSGLILDWEPINQPSFSAADKPRRRYFERNWATLLSTYGFPGTIAYGIDPSVHWGSRPERAADRYDAPTGTIANMLRARWGRASFGLDYYWDKIKDRANYPQFCAYRRARLHDVGTLAAPSVQFLCGVWQIAGEDRAVGDPLPMELMYLQVAEVNPLMGVCLFAPASTPEAAAKVDEATKTLAGLVGGAV